MNRIDAVLFDLDGTLLNTIADLANASNFMLRRFGYPEHSVESYKYKVGNGMRRLMERALPEDHRSKAEIERALGVFMAYYSAHSLDETAPYGGIPELLEELRRRGVRLAVVTNKAQPAAEQVLRTLLPGCFDVIAGQRDGVPTKPDPTLTLNVMQRLGVSPQHCAFVGDSGVDMQTAANCGAFAVGVLWGFRTREELEENGANAVIHAPNELINLLF
ncbi:MAG: HAD family hydrolase [Acutalibacteraceae bacterium]